MCNVEKVNVEHGKVKSVTYRNKRSKEEVTVETFGVDYPEPEKM